MIAAKCCLDYIPMLIGIPPNRQIFEREKYSNIFDRYANLKYKYGNRMFWCGGYDIDIVGKNKKNT